MFHRSHGLLDGCSIGDWGRLPPVMDLLLYTTVSSYELSDLGSANYHLFNSAIILIKVMRQKDQAFQDFLMRLRKGELTVDDWKVLMKRTPARVKNTSTFEHAFHFFPTAAMAADYNATKLRANT